MKLLILTMLLCGCGGGVYQSSGKPAPAPEGWAQLCRDQPTYPGCQPKVKHNMHYTPAVLNCEEVPGIEVCQPKPEGIRISELPIQVEPPPKPRQCSIKPAGQEGDGYPIDCAVLERFRNLPAPKVQQ